MPSLINLACAFCILFLNSFFRARVRVPVLSLSTFFFAFLNIAAGAALFLDTQFAANWAGGLFGLAFGINGLAHIAVAVRSRPFLQWLGTLLTGIAMLAGAVLLLTHTIGEHDVLFGVMIGVNLILGGLSTLWLRWSARRASAQATPNHANGRK